MGSQAILMGVFAGSVPWVTMIILHKKSESSCRRWTTVRHARHRGSPRRRPYGPLRHAGPHGPPLARTGRARRLLRRRCRPARQAAGRRALRRRVERRCQPGHPAQRQRRPPRPAVHAQRSAQDRGRRGPRRGGVRTLG
jgi:hypothetical protein